VSLQCRNGCGGCKVLLGNEKTAGHEFGGGTLTPAILEIPFIERIRAMGANLEGFKA
jgi:hypothetical protein